MTMTRIILQFVQGKLRQVGLFLLFACNVEVESGLGVPFSTRHPPKGDAVVIQTLWLRVVPTPSPNCLVGRIRGSE
jgi:hypothetical protein